MGNLANMKRLDHLLLVLFAALPCACSSNSPANIAGTYSVQITNGSNGCNLANYTVGNVTMDVGVTITQSGGSATATVTGTAGAYVQLVLGSDAFEGSVDGDDVDLQLDGTRAQTSGNCTYTYNAILTAALASNSLSGKIDYTPATNGNSDCAAIAGCITEQDFAGSRAPQ